MNEIAKRRQIACLGKILRKIKIDKKPDFYVFTKFDEILILSIRFKNNAKLNREELYQIINLKKYFNKNQQNLKRFLRKYALTKFKPIFA